MKNIRGNYINNIYDDPRSHCGIYIGSSGDDDDRSPFLLKAVPVPPPANPIVDQFAETLGLLPGLQAWKFLDRFSCAKCHKRQKVNSWAVKVPDGVRPGMAAARVIENCRLTAYNGTFSMWCLECANKLGAEPWHTRLRKWLRGKTDGVKPE